MREVKKDLGELTQSNGKPKGLDGVDVPEYAVIAELEVVLKFKSKKNGKNPVGPTLWMGRRRTDQQWEEIPRTAIQNLEESKHKGRWWIVVSAHPYDRIAPHIHSASGSFRVKLEATFTE